MLQPRQYRQLGFSVDAYLDLVVVEYGYIKIQLGEKRVYAPRILAEIKLVSNSGKEGFLSDRLSNLLTDSCHVVGGADPRHCFDSPKEVLDHPQQAIEGIRAATASISDLIAEAMTPHSSTLFVYGAPKSNLKVDILVDGKPAAAISGSSCLSTTLPPGKHMLRTYVADYDYAPQEGEARVELAVEEGKTYYVRTLARFSGFAKRRCKIGLFRNLLVIFHWVG
jgi:hypothetical protein